MLFAVSDPVWNAIIAGIVTIVLAWIGRQTKVAVESTAKEVKSAVQVASSKAVVAANEARAVVMENTATQNEKLEEIHKVATEAKKTGEDVHTLVNSNMGTQLRISMVALRRVAELTNHPDDKAAAELAEKSYHDHQNKQTIVDEGGKIKSEG